MTHDEVGLLVFLSHCTICLSLSISQNISEQLMEFNLNSDVMWIGPLSRRRISFAVVAPAFLVIHDQITSFRLFSGSFGPCAKLVEVFPATLMILFTRLALASHYGINVDFCNPAALRVFVTHLSLL